MNYSAYHWSEKARKSAESSQEHSDESKQWAIGEPTEPAGGSAKYWAGQASQGQIQSDWTQTDNTKKDYIKNKPSIINNTTSTSVVDVLAAAVGKTLQDQINNLQGRGKYLSIWDCTSGLAMDEPPVNPYTYETGSFFIVGKVASAGGTNYKPNGATYDKDVPSTTIETGTVKVNGTYYYDGTVWRLLDVPEVTVAFSTLAGSPYDNTNLANALNGKQPTLPSGTTGDYLQKTASGVQWSAINALQNTATGESSLTIAGTSGTKGNSVNIGFSSESPGEYSVGVGWNACARGNYCVAIGRSAVSYLSSTALGHQATAGTTTSSYAVSIGSESQATQNYSIQLGRGTNQEANSMYVGLSSSNNYKLLGSDGNIPVERLSNSVTKNNISNCITEIPQDIKLELNNGTLTLKAGSKVYVPNGAGAFKQTLITTNITRTGFGSSTANIMVFVNNGSFLQQGGVAGCLSGSGSVPSTGIYYKTDTNKFYVNGTETPLSLPICILYIESGVAKSIDKVFDGFGYIGSTVFALPSVKGLIPNGRNADGSLKNTEFTLTAVKTFTKSSDTSNTIVLSGNDLSTQTFPTSWNYDEQKNIVYNVSSGDKRSYCVVGNVLSESTKITSFTPKTTFHALDYNDKSTIIGWGMPDYDAGITKSNNTSYTESQDGFIKFYRDYSDFGGSTMTLTIGTQQFVFRNNNDQECDAYMFPVPKGVSYNLNADNRGHIIFFKCKGEV